MPFVPVARTTDVGPNRPRRVELTPDTSIALFNIAGEFFAIEDRCTHAAYPLSDGDVCNHEVTCPLHGATFNVRTGQPTCGPCYGPVRTYPLRIVSDQIEIDLATPLAPATAHRPPE